MLKMFSEIISKVIIDFLRESSVAQHVYDPKAISENGQVGAHITKEAPKYIVEVL